MRKLKSIATTLARGLLNSRRMTTATDFVTRNSVASLIDVRYKESTLQLAHPNPQIRSRNSTFASKEPDTLQWIESFDANSVMWDIGANVGLYSVFAAIKGHTVVAIEPSVFNLEFLVRNIVANHVNDRVSILPIAIGKSGNGFSTLNLKSTAWGDSQNAFATELGQSGRIEKFEIRYRILGMELDSLQSRLGLPQPKYIKIDVDGLEPEILESGIRILKGVMSVLVEIPTYERAEERIHDIMNSAGLKLQGSLRRNQVWARF
jgi:FkbM family methyltransferase